MFEDLNDDEAVEEEEIPVVEEEEAEEGSNRTFLYIAAAVAALILIGIIVVGIWLWSRSGGGQAARDQRATEIAQAYSQQTQVAFAQMASQTAASILAIPSATNTPVPPTNTPRQPTATSTPVVAIATNTPDSQATLDPRVVTLTALYDQLTKQALTPLAPTTTALSATALPDTGLFDEFGAPQLFALAALALIVIFLMRRLRTATQ